MSVGLSSAQRSFLVIVNQVLAAHPKWSYLDPAWIMAIADIESGYQPLVWNGAGRQDGILQVIPTTAAQMASVYGIPAGPQTDPAVSANSGIAYLDYSARSIIKERNAVSLPLWDLVQAYNEGFGAVEAGKTDPNYLVKFQRELPIIEAQMSATAATTNRASFSPKRSRAVLPLSVKI